MKLKQSKTWDVKLHWLRDKANNKYINVFWDKGSDEGVEYFSKHFPTIHQRQVIRESKYVHDFKTDLKENMKLFSLKCDMIRLRWCVFFESLV